MLRWLGVVCFSVSYQTNSTGVRQPGCHGFFSFRPVALRPRLATSLPFRSVSLTKFVLIYARIMQYINGNSESRNIIKIHWVILFV